MHQLDACVDRQRSLDRPLIAHGKPMCYEWLCLRLSGASEAKSGWSPASQACSASTLVMWVAAGCLTARLLRYFGSRQKFSFFRPSGAATRRGRGDWTLEIRRSLWSPPTTSHEIRLRVADRTMSLGRSLELQVGRRPPPRCVEILLL